MGEMDVMSETGDERVKGLVVLTGEISEYIVCNGDCRIISRSHIYKYIHTNHSKREASITVVKYGKKARNESDVICRLCVMLPINNTKWVKCWLIFHFRDRKRKTTLFKENCFRCKFRYRCPAESFRLVSSSPSP
jgi:hypothetical protein